MADAIDLVGRPYVSGQVIAILTALCPGAAVDEAQDLKLDLGLPQDLLKSLAKTWTKVAQRLPDGQPNDAGLPITREEAGKLPAVKDAIDLVYKRANGRT